MPQLELFDQPPVVPLHVVPLRSSRKLEVGKPSGWLTKGVQVRKGSTATRCLYKHKKIGSQRTYSYHVPTGKVEEVEAAIALGKNCRQIVEDILGKRVFGDEVGNYPFLPSSAPTLVELFAGGGGVAAGAVMVGIRPLVAVECDPTKPELSGAIAPLIRDLPSSQLVSGQLKALEKYLENHEAHALLIGRNKN